MEGYQEDLYQSPPKHRQAVVDLRGGHNRMIKTLWDMRFLVWHKNYLTLQSLCQSSMKEVFLNPFHFYISSPILSKIALKDSVLKIVFIDGVTSQNWMKNKQFIAVMILQVVHFVTERCLSKIQNLQRILKDQKMKNVRFL